MPKKSVKKLLEFRFFFLYPAKICAIMVLYFVMGGCVYENRF